MEDENGIRTQASATYDGLVQESTEAKGARMMEYKHRPTRRELALRIRCDQLKEAIGDALDFLNEVRERGARRTPDEQVLYAKLYKALYMVEWQPGTESANKK